MEEVKQRQEVSTFLQISERGELQLKGNLPDNIQPILDASVLQSREYRRHQEKLDRSMNLMSIYMGIILSVFFGLSVFCLTNQKPQVQHEAKVNVKSIIS